MLLLEKENIFRRDSQFFHQISMAYGFIWQSFSQIRHPYCLLVKHRKHRLRVKSIDSISSTIREHLIQFNFVINLMFNPWLLCNHVSIDLFWMTACSLINFAINPELLKGEIDFIIKSDRPNKYLTITKSIYRHLWCTDKPVAYSRTWVKIWTSLDDIITSELASNSIMQTDTAFHLSKQCKSQWKGQSPFLPQL